MARHVVRGHDYKLLGRPSKQQTLALVGWLALCDAFGQVTSEHVPIHAKGLPPDATRWIGELMALAGRGHRNMTADKQQVVSNGKRRVKARKSPQGLTT